MVEPSVSIATLVEGISLTSEFDDSCEALANHLEEFIGLDSEKEEVKLLVAVDEMIRNDSILPLLFIVQGCQFDANTLEPMPPTPKQNTVLMIITFIITAADILLRKSGWEIIEAPEDGSPAFLHRSSSIIRNTPPDIPYINGEPLTWSQQLLLDVPTLARPMIGNSLLGSTSASGSSSVEHKHQRQRVNKTSSTSSNSKKQVRERVIEGNDLCWPVKVVTYVRSSHSVLDVMVDGRVDVIYRQLIRHDLTGAWKHTHSFAAVELSLQQKLDTVKDKKSSNSLSASVQLDVQPLSFTKTTMTALTLLLNSGWVQDGTKDDKDIHSSSGNKLERIMGMLDGVSIDYNDLISGDGGVGDDDNDLVVPSFNDFINGNFDPSQFEGYDISESTMLTHAAATSQSLNPPCPRFLILGVSNCCDVLGFLQYYFVPHQDGSSTSNPSTSVMIDVCECYGEKGFAISRLHDMNKHFNVDLDTCNYVSMDCNTFSEALVQLEKDGEGPLVHSPESGSGSGSGSSQLEYGLMNGYSVVYLDWSTECGEPSLSEEKVQNVRTEGLKTEGWFSYESNWVELSSILTKVTPWLANNKNTESKTNTKADNGLSPFSLVRENGVVADDDDDDDDEESETAGVIAIGLGSGFASHIDMMARLQSLCATCGLAGFRTFSDLVFRDDDETNAECVLFASVSPDRLENISPEAWAIAFDRPDSTCLKEEKHNIPMVLSELYPCDTSSVATTSTAHLSTASWLFWADDTQEVAKTNIKDKISLPSTENQVWSDVFGDDDSDDDSNSSGAGDGDGSDLPLSDTKEEASMRRAWNSIVLPFEIQEDESVGADDDTQKGELKVPSCSLLYSTKVDSKGKKQSGNESLKESIQSAETTKRSLSVFESTLQRINEHGYAVQESILVNNGDQEKDATSNFDEKSSEENNEELSNIEKKKANKRLVAYVKHLIISLQQQQLPPTFVYMYDHTWELILNLFPLVEKILGLNGVAGKEDDCVVLEPSFAAFRLNAQKAEKSKSYVGHNFSKPHRDYSYTDSFDSDSSSIKVLSVWIPLNQITTDNGCMYIVPREYDANFNDPSGSEKIQEPELPVEENAIRPLAPYPAGTFMCWTGNTIHWGSSCSKHAKVDPRTSLALVFRVKSASLSHMEQSLSYEDVQRMTMKDRLEKCQAAVRFFAHWYPSESLSFNLPS